jgi:hypothetical protein
MRGNDVNILTCTDKIRSFEEKLALWGARIKKGNKSELSELTKCCTLDKNLIDLILEILPQLSKNTGKHFPSLDESPSDMMRDTFVIRALDAADVTVAKEDELTI